MREYILKTLEHVGEIGRKTDREINPNATVLMTVGDLMKAMSQALETGANNPHFKDRSQAANAATNGIIALVEDGHVVFGGDLLDMNTTPGRRDQ